MVEVGERETVCSEGKVAKTEVKSEKVEVVRGGGGAAEETVDMSVVLRQP